MNLIHMYNIVITGVGKAWQQTNVGLLLMKNLTACMYVH